MYFVNKIVIFLLLFRWYNVVEREEIIMSVLKLENVKKYYGVKNNITKAVDGIVCTIIGKKKNSESENI